MNKEHKASQTKGFGGFLANIKLRAKITFGIALQMILITIAILIAINHVIYKNMLQNKQEMVETTVGSVEAVIRDQRTSLERCSGFLSNNALFIDSINVYLFTGEHEDIQKQTLDIQKEMNVERIMVCHPKGNNQCEVIIDTQQKKECGASIPTLPICIKAEEKGFATELLLEEDQFNLKLCRVIRRGQETLAYLIIDNILGSDLAHQIEEATGAEIALLKPTGSQLAKVVASAHDDLLGKDISGGSYQEMLSTKRITYQPDYKVDGEVHMVAYKPLFGANQEMIGTLMILVHMDDMIQLRQNTTKAMGTIGIVAILIGLLPNIFLVNNIMNPIQELLLSVQAIGDGNLSQRIKIHGNDEVGQLSSAFGQMQENLINMVKQIKGSVEMLESSSVELSTSSREQADGSMQQSSALTETSTTVEELAATSKQIAENAQMVAELARQSLAGMEAIRNNTDQEANRILTLGEKSQTIGEVIAMIDDIAKQTNILALNASIEAERAGEAGKGFAVVAIEIRELATNVAKSTKQIREIIKEIQDATNASVMATENVGKSVEEGIELSKKAAESANQISMATQQQGSASEQVVAAIKQMSDIVGQTTAGANQIADTAHQLVELTSEQKKVIEQFNIH